MLIKYSINANKPLNVLPMFIPGHMGNKENSNKFLKAVIDNPLKLGASLQNGLFNPPETIEVVIGNHFSVDRFKNMNIDEITKALREEVYGLSTHNTLISSKQKNK